MESNYLDNRKIHGESERSEKAQTPCKERGTGGLGTALRYSVLQNFELCILKHQDATL